MLPGTGVSRAGRIPCQLVRRAGPVVAAAAGYLAVAVAAWWHLWTGGVTHTVTASGYGDPAQQIWFLAWVPHALGAGLDPFVSHAMFAPAGINLMANTSILFPAFVASPVTVLFGPLVAFNVLVVLAPATSALVAFLVFRRYSGSQLACFLGGLFYGFSPFVLNDLADGHLHVTTLVFPPLVLLLLDDIAVSRRGSAPRRGLLLGLVLAAQALTSLEVLAMVVLAGFCGLALLALRFPRAAFAHLRRVLAGLGTAALTAGLLLAFPAEVLFFGPRRYKGTIFSSPESYVVWLKALVWPQGGSGTLPRLWPAYVGIPLLLVVAGGALVARRVRFAAALAVIALVLGMGRSLHLTPRLGTGIPLPDRLFTRAPLFENLLPVRFMIIVDLLVALALAVTLGELSRFASSRRASHASGRLSGSRRGALVAGSVGVLALVSPALGAPFPYPTRQVSVPAVYRSPALTRLPTGSVLLAYPVMNGFEADPMIWQASEDMPYDMVAGYGFIPSGGPRPAGSLGPSPLTDLFGYAQLGLLGPRLSSAQEGALRRQLARLEVSDIVLLDVGKQPDRLASLLSRLLGRRPERLDGAFLFLHLRPPALAKES